MRGGAAVCEGAATLRRLAERWSAYGPPVIVFNKSHSGSRVLARLLSSCGVFMGAARNESEDAADMLRLVRPMVERHYPDYGRLFRAGDPDLEPLVDSVLARHLSGHPPGAPWGWKLCETLYILPILARLFPAARCVHLLRDGRDVAFADHVAPVKPFWRKVYFDTDAVVAWGGRPLTDKAYRRAPHVFNARHWVNSVTVGRHFGTMLGERYFEVRYEQLVLDTIPTARGLLADLALPAEDETLMRFAGTLRRDAIGKHRRQPARAQAEVLSVLQPTLAAFGYGDPERPRRRGWWARR